MYIGNLISQTFLENENWLEKIKGKIAVFG